MVQKILLSSLVVGALLLSGCGDSEGEERLELQQALDKGNYGKVVSTLSSKANLTNEEKMMLGAAYMGKAGMSFSDIASVVLEVGENSDDGDLFADFVGEVGAKNSPTALVDLTEAKRYFKEVIGTKCVDPGVTLTNTQKDVCLYIGLTDSMKAASAINSLAGDVSVLSDSNNGTDNKLQASSCAMQYAFDGGSGSCTVDATASQITFLESNQTYQPITVTANAEEFDYLVTTTGAPEATAMTDGYCTLASFETRADYNRTSAPVDYYICPVSETNTTEITSTDVLVDALNDGTDSIAAAGNDDMKQDIEDFKQEILDSAGKPAGSEITEEDIIAYLNDNN